eukprot:TRINITY_DN24556_c0_g1_i1.p1 TRINITY_DN24556_c0_g1~~TRINITY_DN24556_c0_g1_i1.p1  ORF type:complete len:354 (-),score=73.71 TRINITY_DN24556_c0_g1_i1:37-1098(-)
MDDDMERRISRPVALRPGAYSAEKASGSSQSAKPKVKMFKPTKPSQQKSVEKMSMESTAPEDSVTGLLHSALRRQSVEFAAGRPRDGRAPERFTGQSLSKFGMSSSSTSAAGMGAGGAMAQAPRKAKERGDGKSMDLLDLAFSGEHRLIEGDYKTNYAPISLPYFTIEDEDNRAENELDLSQRAKTRPTLVHIDEANSKAGSKFLGSQGELLEDSYFLVQLPSVLPELQHPEEEVQRQQDDASSAGAGATITRLPDGKLGKLKIYKSGKVKMDIGGTSFCVDQGSETFFQQELALVCPLASEMINLGRIHNRMVLTPDLETIFADLGNARDAQAQAKAAAAPAETLRGSETRT